MSDCPTRFSLIQYQTCELPEEELRDVQAHIAECPDCADIIRRFKERDARCKELREQSLARIHVERSAPLSLAKSQYHTWWRHPILYPALGTLVAAMVIIYFVMRSISVESELPLSDIRYKGDAVLEVFVIRNGNRFEVEEDSKLQAGDILEFGATISQSGYLAFFALHPSRHRATYLIAQADRPDPDLAKRVTSSGYYRLRDGVTLTNKMHGEIYLLVYSKDPFPLKQAEDRAIQLMNDHRIVGAPFGILDLASLRGVFFKLEISKQQIR